MSRISLRYYILLLPVLFGLLASCFASTTNEAASQGQPKQAGLPAITVYKSPT